MENFHQAPNYSEAQKQALILSMCGPLISKVKMLFANPNKNKILAQNPYILSIIDLISEYLLPQYCAHHYNNAQKLSTMHSLCYLLASKVQAVFTAGVIRTCIDQNWDMKGFKSVLLRILQEMECPAEDSKKLQDFFEKLIQAQNLQSQSCIKAISSYLRNKNKAKIDEDDLKNPITSFQTSFEFVRAEIQKFRDQNMSHSCFTVLHPWAYDLDLVDFKYVISKDQTAKITQELSASLDAQVLWLSYFKAQLSISADEFFAAIREICNIANRLDYFESRYETYKAFMVTHSFTVSLHEDSEQICRIVSDLSQNLGHSLNILKSQVKLRTSERQRSEYLEEAKLAKVYNISGSPDFQVLTQHSLLKSLAMHVVQEPEHIDLIRQSFKILPTEVQKQNLYLKFSNVDTEELKDLEIKFDGNLSQFKVGEGDCNHYVITNDKKLWESQFMIVNHQGRYYIRDLGIVHTSRVKVNPNTALQIHKGSLLDLGKVVHYHVDKLFHEQVPTVKSEATFNTMKGEKVQYLTDEEAVLRARPTWISADENKDLVQNEILLEVNNKKQFTIGRSNRRDVEIKLKAVSADHCRIEYSRDCGWFIHELDKDRLSSNGTFVFMKSLQQMDDHEPSDLIPLFNGMTVSFINYELQVRLEPKSEEEIKLCKAEPVVIQASKEFKSAASINPQMHKEEEKKEAPHKEVTTSPYDETLAATTKPAQKHNDIQEEDAAKLAANYYDEDLDPNVPQEEKDAQSHRQSTLIEEKKHHETNYDNEFNESPKKQPVGLYDGDEDVQPAKSQSVHKESPQKNSANLELYDSSPKAKSQMGSHPVKQDDDEVQAMKRSYSQHHIGEAQDGQNKAAKSIIVHSDDEEEVKHQASPVKDTAQPEHTQEEENKSEKAQSQKQTPVKEANDDVKSQKSMQSTPAKEEQQHEEVKSHRSQNQTPAKDQQHDNDAKSQKSIHSTPVQETHEKHESPSKDEAHAKQEIQQVKHDSPAKQEVEEEFQMIEHKELAENHQDHIVHEEVKYAHENQNEKPSDHTPQKQEKSAEEHHAQPTQNVGSAKKEDHESPIKQEQAHSPAKHQEEAKHENHGQEEVQAVKTPIKQEHTEEEKKHEAVHETKVVQQYPIKAEEEKHEAPKTQEAHYDVPKTHEQDHDYKQVIQHEAKNAQDQHHESPVKNQDAEVQEKQHSPKQDAAHEKQDEHPAQEAQDNHPKQADAGHQDQE